MRPRGAITLAALACLGTGALAQGQPHNAVWTNPQRSVHVRAEPCGRESPAMCGTVIWANAKAQADARRGGTDPLIGARLFQNFVPEGKSAWRGKVLVPDINKTFSGTIILVDAKTLRAQGCLIGRIGCKSQTWTLVDTPAR
ncbi:DUF2147 domain-containing protein [Sphingobium nicotianae]|uniref:DUF2147 domain-containing protein n=1 Tax=Sphingobium nicotianae TaxID=2782607 RepID=A0A9X1IRJ1_9SPHN|nr:DUF2147 domain-containing protein [Sphingobium nicotianae]MBT2187245.1 DUF2147 domain-containing protein [Sphingobium nicotianae]